MRRGNIIVLLAALVMGVVAAFMARSWLQRQTVVQPEQDTNERSSSLRPRSDMALF